MHISLLTIILSTFVTSISAVSHVIKTAEGLRVNHGGYLIAVGSSDRDYWDIDQLSPEHGKNWNVIHFFGKGFIQFGNFADGEIARVSNHAAIYHFEKDGEDSYIIPIEANEPGNRLAWTVEEYSEKDKQLGVKLRPYTRAPNQRFRLIMEEYNG